MKISNVYIEKAIKKHRNTERIISKIKYNNIIICENYSEIFNSQNQNFRIQKRFPSIILAKKYNKLIYEAPKGFTIGHKRNYYFSHMLNCIYDCSYCYLQGMLNSANYLLFINYEDFFNEIERIIEKNNDMKCFFSGYDSDSLALENITNFVEQFLKFFSNTRNDLFEIRSKSVNISVLKKIKPQKNFITALSLNPEFIVKSFEEKTPSLKKRILALQTLQEIGWQIGLRFDPLIFNGNKNDYKFFFEKIFKSLDVPKIHSVTIGSFRMPIKYLKKISKIRPNDNLIQTANLKRLFDKEERSDEKDFQEFCLNEIAKFIEKKKIFIN